MHMAVVSHHLARERVRRRSSSRSEGLVQTWYHLLAMNALLAEILHVKVEAQHIRGMRASACAEPMHSFPIRSLLQISPYDRALLMGARAGPANGHHSARAHRETSPALREAVVEAREVQLKLQGVEKHPALVCKTALAEAVQKGALVWRTASGIGCWFSAAATFLYRLL